MRYIGNKTKLLPFIGSFLDRLRIPPGRSLDAFAGTAAVGSYLKARGASVVGCDLMTFSYVLQRAYVVADTYPPFIGLRDDKDYQAARARSEFARHVERRLATRTGSTSDQSRITDPLVSLQSKPLAEVLVYLDTFLEPHTSFVSRHFAAPYAVASKAPPSARDPVRSAAATAVAARRRTSGGATRGATLSPKSSRSAPSPPRDHAPPGAARMYFTLESARRVDAIRHRMHDWRTAGVVDDSEYFLLLAALLEAADAIANTAGVYAAYIKSWQSNALRELQLRLPTIVPRAPLSLLAGTCEAHLGDVSAIAPQLGHFDLLYLDPPYNTRQYSGYYHVPEIIARGWFDGEPDLRGKTGLLGDAKKSVWSTRAGCVSALERLLAETDAEHVVMSYNSEGIIPEADIVRLFREHGLSRTFQRVTRTYARYRSDRPSATRNYKADSVRECLYYVRKTR